MKDPNLEPVIGSYNIVFKDGKESPSNAYNQTNRVSKYTVKTLSTGQKFETEYGSYVQKNSDCCQVFKQENPVVLITNEEDYKKGSYAHSTATIYSMSDVVHVRVLVDYDKDTWVPVYENMTYEEALEYGKSL